MIQRGSWVRWVLSAGVVLAGVFSPWPESARAEHTRVTYPSAVSAEILGRAMLYSFAFDQVVSDELAAGVGIGAVPLQTVGGMDLNQSTGVVPIYVNYYFQREQNSPFATFGADVLLSSSAKGRKSTYGDVEFSSSSVIPTFGLGFESRTDRGFLFRVAGYGLAAKKLSPWLGFSFGYAF